MMWIRMLFETPDPDGVPAYLHVLSYPMPAISDQYNIDPDQEPFLQMVF